MVVLIILAILILLVFLVLMISIGIDFRIEDGVIRFAVKISRFRLQLLPKQKREKKEKKSSEEKPSKPPKETKKNTSTAKKHSLHINADDIIDLLGVLFRGIGSFGKKWKVERFILHWVAAGFDPYITAKVFVYVNDALSQLAPICANRYRVKECSVWTDIDFIRDDMLLEFGVTMSIRIGQILGVGIVIAFSALKVLLRCRKRTKQEEKEENRLKQLDSAA